MSLSLPEPPTSEDSVDSSLGLILVILCAFFFALYHSNAAYTSDEVWSVKTASLGYSSLLTTLRADVHPPLYFQVLHGWVRLVGTGEQAVRSLSGLFYLLAIISLYHLARQLYGKKLALVCAVLYACSPLAILSAQFARMYALLSLLSILSTSLYLQSLIKSRYRVGQIALYVAVNVLGTFTHIAFFFTFFAQVVSYFLLKKRIELKKFAVALLLSVIPYLIFWAPVLFGQIRNSAEGLAWVKKPGLSMLADLLLLYGGVFWLVLPFLLYLSWRKGLWLWNELIGNTWPAALLTLTILPPLLLSIVKPIFNSRLAIVGLHLFALTVCPLFRRSATYLVPLVLIGLTSCFMLVVRPSSETCDNRSLALYLKQTAHDKDVAIFTSLTRMPIDYYLKLTTRKELFETSFPAEIDSHPGYEGRIADPSRKTPLEQEARELVDRIATMQATNKGLRVFFFHGSHPEIDSLVEKELEKRFERVPDQELRCAEGSPYLTTVSVYGERSH